MRHFLSRSLLFILPGVIVLSSFFALLTPVVTHAAAVNPQETLKRWLYYRGMRACLSHSIDNVTLSKDDVNKGKWKVTGKSGFGYLGPSMDGGNDDDGTVSCDDGSIWVRGATAFGFPDAVHFYCGIASGVVAESKGSAKLVYNGEKCEDSSKFKLAGLNPELMQRALTDALERTGDRPKFDINDNAEYKSMLYLIGARSLETFCGGGVLLKDGVSKQTNDDNRVLVDIIKSDGTIDPNKTYFLKGDRDENSKVDDVYYNQGGDDNSAKDLRCHEMAKMTRDNSDSYSIWAKAHPEDFQKIEAEAEAESDDPPTDADESSCAVDGVGWIVCPVMNFIGDLNDKAYGFLSNTFLQLDPDLLGADAETAWKSFRDIANVAFVLVFLILIYSQITGAGMSNYGLKKMLPKLIIAAILVNISFILCKVAVDISNIVGNSVPSFFDVTFSSNADTTPTTASTDMPLWKDVISDVLIAGTAVVGLVLVISLGLPGLLALIVIVLILVARKAAIILLVVISPLAFVAYLLPNTEQWFKKWWKILSSLLILYPIIGVVFGASALAAKIINNNGDMIMQMTALGVSVLPLFAVPLLLKGSMSALGAIGSKLSNLSDKATGAATKGSKERLGRHGASIEAKMANSDNRYARLAGGFRNRRAFSRKSMETESARGQQQALTQHVLDNQGKYNSRQVAEAKSASLKEYNEEVGREKSTMSDLDHSNLMNIVKDKDASEERRAAAAGVIGSRSYRKGHQELLDYVGDESHVGDDGKVNEAIKTIQQQTAYDMKDQPIGMGDQDKSALGEGKFTKPTGTNAAGEKRTVSQEALLQRLHEGKLSEQAFASMNPDDLKLIQELKTGGHLTTEAQATIDGVIDRLKKPEMSAVYAASKDNARKIHATLHS